MITQHREADFWDVKQEWHKHTEDLIKDIICFANTVHDKDCYLIFGITDDLKVCGIDNDEGRRKQSDILDILSTLPFAGDNIPNIEIKTISMLSDSEQIKLVDVDVLIVFNSFSTPYYLKSVKREYLNVMSPGCIYSRVGDRNTPNKGNASIEQIEMLWRKRFGLTKSPYEFIIDNLSHKLDWHEYDSTWYHLYKPEYVLRICKEPDDSCRKEFYSYSQCNEDTLFCVLEIIANKTVLESYEIACIDSGRLSIPVPHWGFLEIMNQFGVSDDYKYYIINSDTYRILEFLYDDSNGDHRYALRNLLRVVLILNDEAEKTLFEQYVLDHKDDFITRVENCDEYDYIDTGKEKKTQVYKHRLRVGVVLNEMLSEFREFLTIC